MQKTLKFSMTLLVFLMVVAVMAISVAAADVGFTAGPKLPANQRDGVGGYFDLMVQPGQKQDLTITVNNQSAEDMVVSMEAVTASTANNGEVNYSSAGVSDETLRYSFSDMVQFSESEVTIPAQSSKDVVFTVAVPDEKFDGIVLGAVRILKALSDEEKNSGQMIVNQYAYVIAVKLQESEAEISPEFVLGNVTAELVNYRASIVANIHNPQPKLCKGASATAQIYLKGSDTPVMELTRDVDFAPNSIFPFTLVDDAGNGIKAGTYIAKIELKYKDRDWSFEQEFQIKAEEAASINQNALNQNQPNQTAADNALGMPLWAVIALSAGSAILMGVVILLVMTMRRMQQIRVNNNRN